MNYIEIIHFYAKHLQIDLSGETIYDSKSKMFDVAWANTLFKVLCFGGDKVKKLPRVDLHSGVLLMNSLMTRGTSHVSRISQ